MEPPALGAGGRGRGAAAAGAAGRGRRLLGEARVRGHSGRNSEKARDSETDQTG